MKIPFLLFAVAVTQLLNAQIKNVDYKDGAQKLTGVSATPAKKMKFAPGILILPAWKGIDNHAKETAEKLAKLGYYAFVADIYGEGNYPKNSEEAGKQAGYYKKNYLDYQKRISLALDKLVAMGANKENIVIMGYCFGGTGALEAARSNMNVRGVASFHGGLGRDASRKIEPIKPKVLVCHGADDPYESPEEVAAFQKEMKDTNADWQMIFYGNAVHAFTDVEAGTDNSKGAAYNEKADKRSWQLFMDFLKEVLE